MNTFALDKNYSQFNFEEISVDELEIISGGSGLANVNDTVLGGVAAAAGATRFGHTGYSSGLAAARAAAGVGARVGLFAGFGGAIGGAIIGGAIGAGAYYAFG